MEGATLPGHRCDVFQYDVLTYANMLTTHSIENQVYAGQFKSITGDKSEKFDAASVNHIV